MGKLELFEMKSSIDDPLVGVEITFDQEVFRPYGESLIYPVIPAEYFYTYEEKPQVIVTIDEFPALCRHLDCDYEYTEQDSLITAFTVTDLDVVITGTALPTEGIEALELGNVACTIVSNTDTEISCTLASPVPAGDWLPKVTTPMGLVKIDLDNVSLLNVALVVTDISPKTGLNPAGGNRIVITGENFPATLDPRYQLTIMIGSVARCVPIEIRSTEIECETEPIVTARRRLQSMSDVTLTL